MSSRAELFKEMRWLGLATVVDRSIKCLRNVWPGGMIFAAKDNLPIKDNRAYFVYFSFNAKPVAMITSHKVYPGKGE